MDQRTRAEDLTELMATWADNVLSRVRIAVPVKLVKDSDGHTVEAQPQIQGLALQPDGSTKFMDLPSFADLPINHHGGGGITITHPHKEGDEGIALMTQQAFNVWFAEGGVQRPGDVRMHALSDAFYVPGVRNQTRALKGVSTTSTQTRTDDKKSVHDVSHKAVTSVREDAAHQVNGMAIQTEKGGSKIHVDAQTIVKVARRLLLNC